MNITTKYNIDENDYLAFNLFYHSITIKRSNKKRWLISCIFLILFFFLCRILNNMVLFFCFSIPFLMYFHLFYFLIIKNNFKRHVKRVHKPSFDEVTFTDDTIDVKSETGKWNIYLSKLVEINEIEKYYFLHFTTLGQAIIIPKEKIYNLSEIEQVIKDISQKYNIKYNVNLNWKY